MPMDAPQASRKRHQRTAIQPEAPRHDSNHGSVRGSVPASQLAYQAALQ
jgi:hypothetical protein